MKFKQGERRQPILPRKPGVRNREISVRDMIFYVFIWETETSNAYTITYVIFEKPVWNTINTYSLILHSS